MTTLTDPGRLRDWFAPLCTACLVATVLVTTGCDTTTPDPESQVVVEAYLRANVSLGAVRLTRSADVDEAYRPSQAAVRNADVVIHRLTDVGGVEETYNFEEERPGVYAPINPPIVRPRTSYRLEATPPDGSQITSTTTVPDTLSITRVDHPEATYQGPNQPTFFITPPQTTHDGQSALVLTTISLLDFNNQTEEELREHLTPPYASNYDADEDTLATFRITSSGLLNEGNFDRTERGAIEARLPWLSVAFFGRNEVAVHVIDENMYDLIRTQQVQQGGGLAPGELPNLIEHVQGGTGIFGSYARTDETVRILRPESDQ